MYNFEVKSVADIWLILKIGHTYWQFVILFQGFYWFMSNASKVIRETNTLPFIFFQEATQALFAATTTPGHHHVAEDEDVNDLTF